MIISIRAATIWSMFVVLSSSALAEDAAQVIRHSKAVTARLVRENGSHGTAFCIDPSGVFVTMRDVLNGGRLGEASTLILNVGEANEQRLPARTIRADVKDRLALVRVEGADFPSLPLGNDVDLFETMPVIALGYSDGTNPADRRSYATVNVVADRISSFRKKDGRVQSIVVEKKLNSGAQGGPMIDAEGRVLGVLQGGKLVLPVSELKAYLHRPVIEFATTSVDEEECYAEQPFALRITSFRPPGDDRKVEVEFQSGTAEPRQYEAKGKNGKYSVTAALIPERPGPALVRIQAEFVEGSLRGRVVDQDVKVGDASFRLSQIRSVEPGPSGELPQVTLERDVRRGVLTGLEAVTADLGGATAQVDLTKALRMTVERIPREQHEVRFQVTVREQGETISMVQGRIEVVRSARAAADATAPANVGALAPANVVESAITVRGADALAVNIPPLRPLKLAKDPTIVQLPAAIDEVVVGAGGRFLILHLKKLQQLAIFDVNEAKVVKYLPLATNDIAYAAGAHKLFIGMKDLRLIQRVDLTTLEREVTVPAPDGGIGAMAMGAEAVKPLILLAATDAKRSYLIDPATMNAEVLAWKGWEGGAWGPVKVHVSLDGTTAIANGGGWAGTGVATFAGGRLTSTHSSTRVQGGALVAGNGALIFPNSGGIERADLIDRVTGIEGTAFPAVDPGYSLSFSKVQNKPKLTLFGNVDPKPIATIRDLPELAANSTLPLSQRVQLIPRANVLITVGDAGDRLILRRFDLAEALEREGIDYLYVESAPVRNAARGTEYAYRVRVRSRRGGVTFALPAAPEGMTISNEGLLSWNVPSRYLGSEATVIVQISDATGQETFHSFKVSVSE